MCVCVCGVWGGTPLTCGAHCGPYMSFLLPPAHSPFVTSAVPCQVTGQDCQRRAEPPVFVCGCVCLSVGDCMFEHTPPFDWGVPCVLPGLLHASPPLRLRRSQNTGIHMRSYVLAAIVRSEVIVHFFFFLQTETLILVLIAELVLAAVKPVKGTIRGLHMENRKLLTLQC